MIPRKPQIGHPGQNPRTPQEALAKPQKAPDMVSGPKFKRTQKASDGGSGAKPHHLGEFWGKTPSSPGDPKKIPNEQLQKP